MHSPLIRFIANSDPSNAATEIEKALAKKLVSAISEHKRYVARETYGPLVEFTSGDEQPVYVDGNDNAYALFYQNALKQFGVQGPKDFTDEQTKKNFFDYIDKGWKNGVSNVTVDAGTQTTLPATAPAPAPPQQAQQVAPQATAQAPVQAQVPAVPPAQAPQPNATPQPAPDDSLAGMNNGDPTIDSDEPLTKDGDDPSLDNPGDADELDGEDGDDLNGDEDSDDLDGDEDKDGEDRDGEDTDSDFDDEDAFTVDPSLFLRRGGDDGDDEYSDESDEDDPDNADDDGDEGDEGDDLGNGGFGQDQDGDDSDDDDVDDEDSDDDSDEDDQDGDEDDDDSDDDDGDDDDSDDDDDDDSDDDDSDDDDDDDDDSDDDDSDDDDRNPKSFGESLADDNLTDQLFISEAVNVFKRHRKDIQTNPKLSREARQKHLADLAHGEKHFTWVQKTLNGVKAGRDGLLKTYRKERQRIKADNSKSNKQKRAALKQIKAWAKESRNHFKNVAKGITGIHTA